MRFFSEGDAELEHLHFFEVKFVATPGKVKIGGSVECKPPQLLIYIQSERLLMVEIFNLFFLINVMILTFIQECEFMF